MKNNVIPLNANCVTPQNVLEAVGARTDIAEIYCVIRTNENKLAMFGSGDLSGMSDAAIYFLKNAENSVMNRQEGFDEDEE